MFRVTLSVVLGAFFSSLTSCSVMSKTDSPHLRSKVSYPEISMVEGIRKVNGRVEVRHSPNTITTILISERFGGQELANFPSKCSIGRFPTLIPSERYGIELLTSIHRDSIRVYNDVKLITHKGTVIYDASVCSVHNLPMERLIEHGMSSCFAPKEFFPAQQKEFPNDGNEYLFCSSGLRGTTWKCPACAKSFIAWHLKRGIRPEW